MYVRSVDFYDNDIFSDLPETRYSCSAKSAARFKADAKQKKKKRKKKEETQSRINSFDVSEWKTIEDVSALSLSLSWYLKVGKFIVTFRKRENRKKHRRRSWIGS